MMHWAEQYVGQPYIEDENDCAAFVERVLREQYGREVRFPAEHAKGYRAQARQIQSLKDEYAYRTDAPQEGDGVLMLGRARMNHIGLYCAIDGAGYVLHAMEGIGEVALHPLRDLPDYGLEVEGIYRWRDQHLPALAQPAPNLVWCPNPISAQGRTEFAEPFLPNESVGAYLERIGLNLDGRDVALYINDTPLTREAWYSTAPQIGDIITARQVMHGGGNGAKVLRTVLMIAVLASTGYAPAWTIGDFAIGKALYVAGGMMMVNAIIPPPSPQLSLARGESDSPTYSINGARNRARPQEPMQLLIGNHRMVPDLGALSFTEFVDNDQVLFLCLNFGLSDITLSNWRIGDTPLTSFNDYEMEESGADGKLTLFPGNVDTLAVNATLVAFPELTINGDFTKTHTPWNSETRRVSSWDGPWRAGGPFSDGTAHHTLKDEDGALSQAVTLTPGTSYRLRYDVVTITQGSVTPFVGGAAGTLRNSVGSVDEVIVAGAGGLIELTSAGTMVGSIDNVSLMKNSAWTTRTSSVDATGLAVDIAALLFHAGDGGLDQHQVTLEIEYRPVGGSWQPWFSGGSSVVLKNSTRTPLRQSYYRRVTQGQYEVRVRRATPADSSDRYTSDITWAELRTYQPDTADYTGQKRVALRIRASGQLQGVADAITAQASAKCEAWNGSAWVTQATSNPAWWFRHIAKGKSMGGRRMYGGLRSDAELDLAAIKDWGAWCATKGLAVNLVFDARISTADALDVIARCGRASRSWGTGKLGVVWDVDNAPVVQRFGMSNILRDSFRVEYITAQLVDAVEVEFINAALDYQPDVVRANVPGVSSPVNVIKVPIMGITNKDQAGKEALLLAGQQYYRRRRVAWDADFEAQAVKRGSVVTVSHDLTQWGYSGRLIAGTTTQLTLDREVPFTVGQTHYIGVRYPDNSYVIKQVVYQAGPSAVLTLAEALPTAPGSDPDGLHPMDYLWFFEPAATPGKRLKVLDIAPKMGGDKVTITATDDDPAYYALEASAFDYTPPANYGVRYPTLSGLTVSDSLIRVGRAWAVMVTVRWSATGEYAGAWIRYRINGEEWLLLQSTSGREVTFQTAPEGSLEIEVVGYNSHGKSGANSKLTTTYAIVGDDDPIADVINFIATQNGNVAQLSRDPSPNIDWAGAEVRRQPLGVTDWDSAAYVTTTGAVSNITTAAIPPGLWTLLIKDFDHNNPPIWSANAAMDNIEMVNTHDVIDVQQQAALGWPGTKTNCFVHWTGKLVPLDQYTADQYGYEMFDTTVPTPELACSYETPESDIGIDNAVRAWSSVQSTLGVGVTSASEPAMNLDSHLAAGAYDGFEPWVIGDREGRHFKWMLEWGNDSGARLIEEVETTLDLQEHPQKWESVTIDVAGADVIFDPPFHRIPEMTGLIYDTTKQLRFDNITLVGGVYTKCKAYIYNIGSNTSVGGTAATITATGV